MRYVTVQEFKTGGDPLTTAVYLKENVFTRPPWRTPDNLDKAMRVIEAFLGQEKGAVIALTDEDHEFLCEQAQLKEVTVNPKLVLTVLQILQGIFTAPKKPPPGYVDAPLKPTEPPAAEE